MNENFGNAWVEIGRDLRRKGFRAIIWKEIGEVYLDKESFSN